MTIDINMGNIVMGIGTLLIAVVGYFLKDMLSEMKKLKETVNEQNTARQLVDVSIKNIEEKVKNLPDSALVKAEMKAAFTRIDELRQDVQLLKDLYKRAAEVDETLRLRIHRMHSMIMEVKIAGETSRWDQLSKNDFWQIDDPSRR